MTSHLLYTQFTEATRRMNPILMRGARKSLTAKINPHIAYGIGRKELESRNMVAYLDMRLKAIYTNTPHGMNYESITRCSPEEQIAVLTKSALNGKDINGVRPNGAEYDISPSDLYLVKIQFSFKGELLNPKYQLLPFCRHPNLLLLSGAFYIISPVLTDKILSPSSKNVFIRLLKDKITAYSIKYTIYVDDKLSPISIVIANIYQSRAQGSVLTRVKTTLVHYLLSKFGYTRMMAYVMPGGDIPKPMTLVQAAKGGFINNPAYTVYRTTGTRPNRTCLDKTYVASTLCFVIPKDKVTSTTNIFIANMIYIIDHKTTITLDDLEDPGIWKIILGEVIFGNLKPNRLKSSIDNHLESLDYYVDPYMQKQIYEEFGDSLQQDFSKDGLYKLFLVTVKRFDAWKNSAGRIAASCYDKKLEVLYFVTYNLFIAFNELDRELLQASRNFLNKTTVQERLNKKITIRLIYAIRKKNASCQLVLYGGDNGYFKMLSQMGLQLNVNGSTLSPRRKMGTPMDATTLAESTHLVGGTVNGISDSKTSPLQFINIFAPYDPVSGTIIPTQYIRDLIKPYREVLQQNVGNARSPRIASEFNRFVKD